MLKDNLQVKCILPDFMYSEKCCVIVQRIESAIPREDWVAS